VNCVTSTTLRLAGSVLCGYDATTNWYSTGSNTSYECCEMAGAAATRHQKSSRDCF